MRDSSFPLATGIVRWSGSYNSSNYPLFENDVEAFLFPYLGSLYWVLQIKEILYEYKEPRCYKIDFLCGSHLTITLFSFSSPSTLRWGTSVILPTQNLPFLSSHKLQAVLQHHTEGSNCTTRPSVLNSPQQPARIILAGLQ